ncbi:43 kDa receptor-associated protein of the synapse isoform X1 [Anopheles sinensis]|uniref:43 kDa receptor-associated protein of the synapse isoform X1 n=1 Tax=Anopheles sinensis TaxID=74873 RepID=A0A084VHW7_ANOSI|nr:43 kDa receptor-associated protein of the synapse isoform X1 [Anopheles sinensis]
MSADKKDVLLRLIRTYRDNPVLWDKTAIDGNVNNTTSRRTKTEAWRKLASILKEIDPDADIQSAKYKIKSLRENMRRARNRVRLRNGVKRIPKLWYYYELEFILQHEDRGLAVNDEDTDMTSNEEDSDGTDSSKPEPVLKAPSDMPSIPPLTVTVPDHDYARKLAGDLGRLDGLQYLLAEKLISDVVFAAEMRHLSVKDVTRIRQILKKK